MPRSKKTQRLSKRESEIMDLLYRHGPSTAAEVGARMEDAPGNSAVRKLLEILERKGIVRHGKEGRQFVYEPVTDVHEARTRALGGIVSSLFRGDSSKAMVALLAMSEEVPSEKDLRKLLTEAAEARRAGR